MADTLLDLFLNSITFDVDPTPQEMQSRAVTEDPDDEDDNGQPMTKSYEVRINLIYLGLLHGDIYHAEPEQFTPSGDGNVAEALTEYIQDSTRADSVLYHHLTSWTSHSGRIDFYAMALLDPEKSDVGDWTQVTRYNPDMDETSATTIASHGVEHMSLLAVRGPEAAEEMGTEWQSALAQYAPLPAGDLETFN